MAAPGDVWAVGYFEAAGGLRQTLTEHLVGGTWQIVPSPNPQPYNNLLHGVTATMGSVGRGRRRQPDPADPPALDRQRLDPAPVIPSSSNGNLLAVAANSATAAWVAGDQFYGANPFAANWDGTTWLATNMGLTCAYMACAFAEFGGIAAPSSTDIWVVGAFATSYGYPARTLIQRWDSTWQAWQLVPSPNGSPNQLGNDNYLRAVAATTATDLWAVGDYVLGGIRHTLIVHYNAPCPADTPTITPTPTDTPTATDTPSATPTVTGTPPTATPTAPACPLGYQDVPPGDPDFAAIHCVTCNGALDNYPCGGPGEPCVPPNNYPYFRPTVIWPGTRRATANLLSRAAGYNDHPPQINRPSVTCRQATRTGSTSSAPHCTPL